MSTTFRTLPLISILAQNYDECHQFSEALIEQQADQIAWLREQVEKLQAKNIGRTVENQAEK